MYVPKKIYPPAAPPPPGMQITLFILAYLWICIYVRKPNPPARRRRNDIFPPLVACPYWFRAFFCCYNHLLELSYTFTFICHRIRLFSYFYLNFLPILHSNPLWRRGYFNIYTLNVIVTRKFCTCLHPPNSPFRLTGNLIPQHSLFVNIHPPPSHEKRVVKLFLIFFFLLPADSSRLRLLDVL